VASEAKVEIVDTQGWRRDFPLERALIHIGSDTANDIVLPTDGAGPVAPRHLQIVQSGIGFRLVNLGDAPVSLASSAGVREGGPAEGDWLAPRHTRSLADGDCVRLGGYVLTFRLGGAVAKPAPRGQLTADRREIGCGCVSARAVSSCIGLEVSLPGATMGMTPRLSPASPIEGIVSLRNGGPASPARIQISLTGLEAGSYDMPPGAILFPRDESRLPLVLRHPQSLRPTEGHHSITIRATAPDAYPEQSAQVSLVVDVAAVYRHSLRQLVESTTTTPAVDSAGR
jgi:hypothetical protein